MNKNFASNFLSPGIIKQDCLYRKMQKVLVFGVFNENINFNTEVQY